MDQERTSHTLGGLAGYRRTLLHMQRRHGRHLQSMTSHQYSLRQSMRINLLEEQSCHISSRSDLKRQSLRFFEERRANKNNKKNNNKMTIYDMGTVSGPKMHW